MYRTPNYPCRLFHRTRPECQLVESEENHKNLHQWKEWVLEDETTYYQKPEVKVEEPSSVQEETMAPEIDSQEEADSDEKPKKVRAKGKSK